MLSLLAAYGDGDDSSVQNTATDKQQSKVPAKKKQKTSSGVVKVVLPVHSTLAQEDLPSQKAPSEATPHAGEKRKPSSISDILPTPKSKQNRSNSSITPSPLTTRAPPAPTPAANTKTAPKEQEEEQPIGPQMPCAADLAYYYEQYYSSEPAPQADPEQPMNPQQYEHTPEDTIAEIAQCAHIPELERNLIVGKKRRGETPVFVDINQKELVQVSEWDEESDQFYRTNAALKNTGASYKQSRKNQLSSLVSSAKATSDILDSRLSRVKQSKAQVRAKYGW